MLVELLVNGKLEQRDVSIEVSQEDKGLCRGKVGKLKFYWRPAKYSLPMVTINGVNLDRHHMYYARKLTKMFLMKYKEMLKVSPMHFEPTPDEVKEVSHLRESVHTHSSGLSGVPKWMRDNHKVWTLCRGPKHTYQRRTRFDKASRALVEFWLPVCSRCEQRAFCEAPCDARYEAVVSVPIDNDDVIFDGGDNE